MFSFDFAAVEDAFESIRNPLTRAVWVRQKANTFNIVSGIMACNQ